MPLLWPQVLAGPLHFALLTHPEFPFPVPGIVHLANRFERRAPIPAGAPLSLTAWTEGFSRTHAGATFVIHTEARVAAGTEASTAGEPIWASTMTVLSRALPGQGERPPKQEEPAVAAARSAVWAVPADQGRRYAAASGDSNPIHTSAIFARISGFPRPIAHGMWTLGRALAELDTDLPEVCALEVQFRSPLLLPSRVCFEGGPEGRAVPGVAEEDDPERGVEGTGALNLCLAGDTLLPCLKRNRSKKNPCSRSANAWSGSF